MSERAIVDSTARERVKVPSASLRRAGLGGVACLFALTVDCDRSFGCEESDYRQAARYVAELQSTQAQQVLRPCGENDALASYLVGMIPRFVDLTDAQKEAYRNVLEGAADRGNHQAQAVMAAWFNDHGDSVRASELAAAAYVGRDSWGSWLGYSYYVAFGNSLSPEDIALLEKFARDGFPLAYGVLALDSMNKGALARTPQPSLEQNRVLLQSRDIALKGAVTGDSLAALVIVKAQTALKIRSQDYEDLADVLAASNPIEFSQANPAAMAGAHRAWMAIAAELKERANDGEVQGLAACRSQPLSKFRELCEVRAGIDHLACLEPFGGYVGIDSWIASAAYLTCRTLRLRLKATVPYY